VPVPASSAIIITGCSTGIGRHAAVELAAAGYVVFAGVRKTSDGDSLTAEAATRGCVDNLVPVLIDVADTASIAGALDAVQGLLASRFRGRKLAALVNNAGINRFAAVEAFPEALVRSY
jgi:NAD(P)-dependent dehydrogenase (short-subunit alcohol dehydrogenase family)